MPFTKDKMPKPAVMVASQTGGTRPLHTSTARKKIVAMPRTMNKKLFRFLISGRCGTGRGRRAAPSFADEAPLREREELRVREKSRGGAFVPVEPSARGSGGACFALREAARPASYFCRVVGSSSAALASDKSLNASAATFRM